MINIANYLESKLGDRFEQVIREVYLKIVDELWINHVNELEILKQVITLRAYGQKDVEVEYDKEAYNLFLYMLDNIRGVFVASMLQLKDQYK